MKNILKVGYLFLAMIVFIFTALPEHAGAAFQKNKVDDLYEELENLDQETLDMYDELDKYLIKKKDGKIILDLEAAKSDGAEPEILNMIRIVNGIEEEVQSGEINSLDFAYPIGNYGRYCGKGNKGGKPIDDLDEACQRHDSCFLGFDNTSDKNKKCNQDFVRDVMIIVQQTYPATIKGAYARAALYLFKKYI